MFSNPIGWLLAGAGLAFRAVPKSTRRFWQRAKRLNAAVSHLLLLLPVVVCLWRSERRPEPISLRQTSRGTGGETGIASDDISHSRLR